MRAIRFGLFGLAIVVVSVACASGNLTPSSTTTTLTYGWQQHFSIQWSAAEQGANARSVSGYVYNQSGESARQIRVLAQALDSTGGVVGQRIAYVPGGVGGFGRSYFIVPNLPVADTYRVSVWDYTWFQAPGRPFP